MIKGLALMAVLVPEVVQGAELRVLSSGAYRGALVEMAPALERETGHRLVISNETAGEVLAWLAGPYAAATLRARGMETLS